MAEEHEYNGLSRLQGSTASAALNRPRECKTGGPRTAVAGAGRRLASPSCSVPVEAQPACDGVFGSGKQLRSVNAFKRSERAALAENWDGARLHAAVRRFLEAAAVRRSRSLALACTPKRYRRYRAPNSRFPPSPAIARGLFRSRLGSSRHARSTQGPLSERGAGPGCRPRGHVGVVHGFIRKTQKTSVADPAQARHPTRRHIRKVTRNRMKAPARGIKCIRPRSILMQFCSGPPMQDHSGGHLVPHASTSFAWPYACRAKAPSPWRGPTP